MIGNKQTSSRKKVQHRLSRWAVLANSIMGFLFISLIPAHSSAGFFPVYSTWPQENGLGSQITITYSFSNLFDNSIRYGSNGNPIPSAILNDAFVTAMQDYTQHLPIDFIEVSDNGPLPETGEYAPTGLADIRIGQVAHIDNANAYAYFPLNTDSSGLSGDIVFNAERFGNGWNETLFYAVAQHELGHSLGMGHFVNDGAPSVGE
ncbi:MAG: matrixin family metalloprotease [Pseudomonadota bacterium]